MEAYWHSGMDENFKSLKNIFKDVIRVTEPVLGRSRLFLKFSQQNFLKSNELYIYEAKKAW